MSVPKCEFTTGITFLKGIFITVILNLGARFKICLSFHPTPALDCTVFPGEISGRYSVCRCFSISDLSRALARSVYQDQLSTSISIPGRWLAVFYSLPPGQQNHLELHLVKKLFSSNLFTERETESMNTDWHVSH